MVVSIGFTSILSDNERDRGCAMGWAIPLTMSWRNVMCKTAACQLAIQTVEYA
jgi:hypothetical protein